MYGLSSICFKCGVIVVEHILLPFVNNTTACVLRRRHDNDAEGISEVSVRPTAEEILCARPPYLPANDLSKCTEMTHLQVNFVSCALLFRHKLLRAVGKKSRV